MATRKPNELDKSAIMALGPAGVELTERQGQQDVVHDNRLPIKMRIADALLEQLGFKLGKVVKEGNPPQFREATFPKGWKKLPYPNHSMHNMILDEKERIRANFFFKAAFYDYCANGDFQTRYACVNHYKPYVEGQRPKFLGVAVVDRAVKYDEKKFRACVLYKVLKLFKAGEDDDAARLRASSDASGWLADNFPLWDGVLVYWDDKD
jgi:hypothetical protein